MTQADMIQIVLSNITYDIAENRLTSFFPPGFFQPSSKMQKQQERCLVWFRQRSCYLSYELKKYSDDKYTTLWYLMSSRILIFCSQFQHGVVKHLCSCRTVFRRAVFVLIVAQSVLGSYKDHSHRAEVCKC